MSSVKAKVNMDNVVTRIIPESYNGHTLPDDSYYVDSPNIGKYPIAYSKVVQYEDVKLQTDCGNDETVARRQKSCTKIEGKGKSGL